MLKMYKRKAKKISYGSKRSLKQIKFIVIHATSNEDDTAKNNVDFFATGNTREAGAHFFVDKQGNIARSIPMNLSAYAVGSKYDTSNGAGAYYNVACNENTVSIELCDCNRRTNWEQMLATRKLVEYIQKKCPNAKTVIRHWDVNGKQCPIPFIGRNNDDWVMFKRFVVAGYTFDAKVLKKSKLRLKPNSTSKKKGVLEVGNKIKIVELRGNYGRIKGDNLWISLDNIREIKAK